MSDYERLIERLDACKPGGWADLWLYGAGAGAALATAALVGVLTLPSTLSGTRDVLWALTAAGAAIFALCLFGYLTQRRDHAREIAELKRTWRSASPSLRPGSRLGGLISDYRRAA